MVHQQDCVKIKVSGVWYDTVDQPVIPVTLSNVCSETVYVHIEVKNTEGRKLFDEAIKLKGLENKRLEITLSYYGKALLGGHWKSERAPQPIPLETIELRL